MNFLPTGLENEPVMPNPQTPGCRGVDFFRSSGKSASGLECSLTFAVTMSRVVSSRAHDLIDRVLRLADENILLRGRERVQLIFMAHVLQSVIAPERIALVLPPRKRPLFYKIVLPLLRGTSRFRSRKALAVAFNMIGIHPDTIADFMGYAHCTVRRLVKKFRNGQYELAFTTHPRRPKKHLRQEVRDKIFAIMHTPPSQFRINRTTWTIDLLRDVLEEEGMLVGKNTISKIIKLEGYNFRKTSGGADEQRSAVP